MIKIDKTENYESIWIEKEPFDLKRTKHFSFRIFGIKLFQRNYEFNCNPIRSDIRNDIVNNKKLGF